MPARASYRRRCQTPPRRHAGTRPFYPTLYTKYVVPPHSTGDYTLLAQFSFPENMLNDRQRFVVKIHEVDGKVAEIREK